MKKIVTILWCAGAFPVALGAQELKKDSTLNRTVTVENQYNPEVMDAFKINVLPKVEEPATAKRGIDYAVNPNPLTAWSGKPMKAVSEEERQKEAQRGYLRGAFGNRMNTDVKAAYLWDISQRDCLDMMASFYGMNGNVPVPESENGEEWKSRFFRTDVSLKYRHAFDKVAFSVGGAFSSQVFGYMPIDDTFSFEYPGRQHNTAGEGYLGVTSVSEELPVRFSLQTGFRSFNRKYAVPYLKAGSESAVHTSGYIEGDLNEEQQVGVGLVMDNLWYGMDLNDYTLLQLNPYYVWQGESARIRIGAHVDWQMGNGGGIKVSPDMAVDYTFADSYVLYVQAGGGTRLNDFRRLNEYSSYWMQPLQLRSSYTVLDAQAGLKASPMAGLGFRLYGGYRITKDEVFVLPATAEEIGEGARLPVPYLYAGLSQAKAKVGYAGASLSYAYKDRFDFALSGTYYGWSLNEEQKLLLWLKPELGIDFSMRAKVFSGLSVSADYRYESRVKTGVQQQADAVNHLSLSANYELFHRMNVFVGFHNLLNQEYLAADAYPVQGFYAMGGLSFRF